MIDYNYWEKHVEIFQNKFGSNLEIDCRLNISTNCFDNIPKIGFGSILMPVQYLELLNAHCNWILCNRNLFHSIGIHEHENIFQESFKEIDYKLSSENFRIKYLPLNFCNKRPSDDRRKKIASMLRDLITYFAIHHELGHARQSSYKTLSEMSYREKSK